MNQTNRLKSLMAAASKLGVVLFRNNVAKAWVGTGRAEVSQKTETKTLFKGDVVLRRARILHAGLFKGSHDLIGYRSITITEDMIGKKAAVFVGVEDKGPNDRLRAEQVKFHAAIKNAGGLSVVAKNINDMTDYLTDSSTLK